MHAVCLKKWDGEGGQKEHIVGVAEDFAVAKELMLRKTLFMLRLCGQLSDSGRLIYTLGADGVRSELMFEDVDDLRVVHKNLIRAHLANQEAVHVHDKKKGFAIRIDVVNWYDAPTVGKAEETWKEHLKEKLDEKEDRLNELEERLGRM